ncbi:MAG TPA: zinc metallopeptidase, partial [Thermotogota bacterium]|nr:zinc metallopeptidase [Thermotogota bacterium]
DELSMVKKVLNAAAMTYVASTLMAVLNLVRMLMISRRSGD